MLKVTHHNADVFWNHTSKCAKSKKLDGMRATGIAEQFSLEDTAYVYFDIFYSALGKRPLENSHPENCHSLNCLPKNSHLENCHTRKNTPGKIATQNIAVCV